MFGFQNCAATCGCGTSFPTAVTARTVFGQIGDYYALMETNCDEVDGSDSQLCVDITNIISWVNGYSLSSLPLGINGYFQGTFDTSTSEASPDVTATSDAYPSTGTSQIALNDPCFIADTQGTGGAARSQVAVPFGKSAYMVYMSASWGHSLSNAFIGVLLNCVTCTPDVNAIYTIGVPTTDSTGCVLDEPVGLTVWLGDSDSFSSMADFVAAVQAAYDPVSPSWTTGPEWNESKVFHGSSGDPFDGYP